MTPKDIAEVQPLPGSERNLRLIGLAAGTATVTIRGEVDGRSSQTTFGIEVVGAGAIEYELATDLGQQAAVYRGGEVATLARGFCYPRTVRILDERGTALDYVWPSAVDLAPEKRREHSCGTDGIFGSSVGRFALPTIGRATPVEAEFIEPTLQVTWNPVPHRPGDPDRGTQYRPGVVATDTKGQRAPLPFGLKLAVEVETPATCEVVQGLVVHRSPQAECRVIVSVPRGPGEAPTRLASVLPNPPSR